MSNDSRRFAGYAMVTVGGLILLLSGPCTLFFAGSALFSMVTGPQVALAVQILVLALVVGGLPALLGWFLVRGGLRRVRQARAGTQLSAGKTPTSSIK